MVPLSSPLHVATHTAFAECVIAALEADLAHLPFVTGGCGSGRTTVLRHLQRHYGDGACQYIDVERSATTPERFLRAVVLDSPFAAPGATQPSSLATRSTDADLAATARPVTGARRRSSRGAELRTFETRLRRAVQNC
jgi:hypothetical protein